MGTNCVSCHKEDEGVKSPSLDYPCRGPGSIRLMDMVIPTLEFTTNPYFFADPRHRISRAERLSSSETKVCKETFRRYNSSHIHLQSALREELLSSDYFRLLVDSTPTGGGRRPKGRGMCTQYAYVYLVGTSPVLDSWYDHFCQHVLSSLTRRGGEGSLLATSQTSNRTPSQGIVTTRLQACRVDVLSAAPCIDRLLELESRRVEELHSFNDNIYARYLFSLVAPQYLELEAAFSYVSCEGICYPQPLSALLQGEGCIHPSLVKLTSGRQLVRLIRVLISGAGEHDVAAAVLNKQPSLANDTTYIHTLLMDNLLRLPVCGEVHDVTHPQGGSINRPMSAGLSSNASNRLTASDLIGVGVTEVGGEGGSFAGSPNMAFSRSLNNGEEEDAFLDASAGSPLDLSDEAEIRVMATTTGGESGGGGGGSSSGVVDHRVDEDQANIPHFNPMSVDVTAADGHYSHPNSISSFDWPATAGGEGQQRSQLGTPVAAGSSVSLPGIRQSLRRRPAASRSGASSSHFASRSGRGIVPRKFLPSIEHVLCALCDVYTAGSSEAFLHAAPGKATDMATLSRDGWRRGWCKLGITNWESALQLARQAFLRFELGSMKDDSLVLTMKFAFGLAKSLGNTPESTSPMWEVIEYSFQLEEWHEMELTLSTTTTSSPSSPPTLPTQQEQRLKDRDCVKECMKVASRLRLTIQAGKVSHGDDMLGSLLAAQLAAHLLRDKWATLPQWISFLVDVHEAKGTSPSPQRPKEQEHTAGNDHVNNSSTPPVNYQLTRKYVSSDVWLSLVGFASMYPRPDVLSTYFDLDSSHWPSLLDDFAIGFSRRSSPQVL